MSILSWSAFKDMYKEGRDCNPMFLEFKGGQSYYYQFPDSLGKLKRGVYEKIVENPRWFEERVGYYETQFEFSKEKLRKLNSELGKNADLPSIFKEYWLIFSNSIFGMAIDVYFDDIVANDLLTVLKTELAKRGANNRFAEYYSILTAPNEPTTTLKEELAFLEIVSRAKDLDAAEIDRLLENHLETYAFVPCWFDNPPWSIDDLKNRLRVELTQNYMVKLQTVRNNVELQNHRTNEIMDELLFNSETRNIIGRLKKFSYIRQEGEVQIGYNNHAGLGLKNAIAGKLRISLEDLKFLTPDEIAHYLSAGESPENLVAERKKRAFMILKDGECLVYSDRAAEEALAKLSISVKPERETKTEELSAMVGNPGYAEGYARIVHGFDEVSKLNRGDILVVSGLSVEYIDAIKKAAAVIAEYGGITSHAAVMCREFQKPCLIRLKDATKILRDGEFIRVDANTGIVKR